jgi:hypothetical protein
LKRGSVILFGSQKQKKFVLDTVFVVDRYYDPLLENRSDINNLKNQVSDTYIDVTLSRILENNCNKSCIKSSKTSCTSSSGYRLYFGATFANPVGGMFSFFPCLPYDKNRKEGFARPEIVIPGVVNPNSNMGAKFTPESKSKMQASIKENKKLWDEVKKQVEQQDLKLGIYTDLPPKK